MKLFQAGSRILISRVGQVAANAAVVMIVAKALGPTGQGYYSLTVAVVMLLSALLGGGMGLAAVPPLRQGRVGLGRMLTAQFLWAGGMALLLTGAAVVVSGGGAAAFLTEHLDWGRSSALVAAAAALAMLSFEIASYDLLARGRLVVGAATNGGRAIGHLVLVATLALTGFLSLAWAVGAFALAQTIGAILILGVLFREYRRHRVDPAPIPPASTGTIDPVPDPAVPDLTGRPLLGLIVHNLRHGWLGQISGVAYFLLLRLDQGLLLHFRDASEVGIYSVAVYLGEMLWLLPGALTPLLVHSSAADAADPERDRTALRAVRWGLAITLVAGVPLFFLGGPLLGLLAGGQYQGSGASLRALLPGIVAFAPGAVLAGDFIGRGKPHWNTQASVLTVVVNVGTGLVLIPAHGAVGAAWASTIAYACGSAWMIFRFRQASGLSLWSRTSSF